MVRPWYRPAALKRSTKRSQYGSQNRASLKFHAGSRNAGDVIIAFLARDKKQNNGRAPSFVSAAVIVR